MSYVGTSLRPLKTLNNHPVHHVGPYLNTYDTTSCTMVQMYSKKT